MIKCGQIKIIFRLINEVYRHGEKKITLLLSTMMREMAKGYRPLSSHRDQHDITPINKIFT